jgi:hypothetical protein
MKAIIAALAIASVTPAAAQEHFFFSQPPSFNEMPVPKRWIGDDGTHLGTATTHGNRTYMRNLKGVHLFTIVAEDGGLTFYDPSGNVLKRESVTR